MTVFSTPLTIALVSVSTGTQNVDNLRRCGAYPLIVQHHVQALVVGNRGESGGDNRLLFGALVFESAALHLKDAALHRSQTAGLLLRFRLALRFHLALLFRLVFYFRLGLSGFSTFLFCHVPSCLQFACCGWRRLPQVFVIP